MRVIFLLMLVLSLSSASPFKEVKTTALKNATEAVKVSDRDITDKYMQERDVETTAVPSSAEFTEAAPTEKPEETKLISTEAVPALLEATSEKPEETKLISTEAVPALIEATSSEKPEETKLISTEPAPALLEATSSELPALTTTVKPEIPVTLPLPVKPEIAVPLPHPVELETAVLSPHQVKPEVAVPLPHPAKPEIVEPLSHPDAPVEDRRNNDFPSIDTGFGSLVSDVAEALAASKLADQIDKRDIVVVSTTPCPEDEIVSTTETESEVTSTPEAEDEETEVVLVKIVNRRDVEKVTELKKNLNLTKSQVHKTTEEVKLDTGKLPRRTLVPHGLESTTMKSKTGRALMHMKPVDPMDHQAMTKMMKSQSKMEHMRMRRNAKEETKNNTKIELKVKSDELKVKDKSGRAMMEMNAPIMMKKPAMKMGHIRMMRAAREKILKTESTVAATENPQVEEKVVEFKEAPVIVKTGRAMLQRNQIMKTTTSPMQMRNMKMVESNEDKIAMRPIPQAGKTARAMMQRTPPMNHPMKMNTMRMMKSVDNKKVEVEKTEIIKKSEEPKVEVITEEKSKSEEPKVGVITEEKPKSIKTGRTMMRRKPTVMTTSAPIMTAKPAMRMMPLRMMRSNVNKTKLEKTEAVKSESPKLEMKEETSEIKELPKLQKTGRAMMPMNPSMMKKMGSMRMRRAAELEKMNPMPVNLRKEVVRDTPSTKTIDKKPEDAEITRLEMQAPSIDKEETPILETMNTGRAMPMNSPSMMSRLLISRFAEGMMIRMRRSSEDEIKEDSKLNSESPRNVDVKQEKMLDRTPLKEDNVLNNVSRSKESASNEAVKIVTEKPLKHVARRSLSKNTRRPEADSDVETPVLTKKDFKIQLANRKFKPFPKKLSKEEIKLIESGGEKKKQIVRRSTNANDYVDGSSDTVRILETPLRSQPQVRYAVRNSSPTRLRVAVPAQVKSSEYGASQVRSVARSVPLRSSYESSSVREATPVQSSYDSSSEVRVAPLRSSYGTNSPTTVRAAPLRSSYDTSSSSSEVRAAPLRSSYTSPTEVRSTPLRSSSGYESSLVRSESVPKVKTSYGSSDVEILEQAPTRSRQPTARILSDSYTSGNENTEEASPVKDEGYSSSSDSVVSSDSSYESSNDQIQVYSPIRIAAETYGSSDSTRYRREAQKTKLEMMVSLVPSSSTAKPAGNNLISQRNLKVTTALPVVLSGKSKVSLSGSGVAKSAPDMTA